MRNRIPHRFRDTTLAARIRISYLLLLIPVFMLVFYSFYIFWTGNRQYDAVLDSIADASEFNLDFKKEYDYQTYLVIVGERTPEESDLTEILESARQIIGNLRKQDQPDENRIRLEQVEKYLQNLKKYQENIEANLVRGNRYEDNMEIWEKDVQIVTSLIQEAVYEYTFYEARGLQAERLSYQHTFRILFRIALILLALYVLWVIFLIRYIPRSISQPIRELIRVTDRVTKGDLSVRSEAAGSQEAAMLSQSLNAMIEQITVLLEQVKNEQSRLRKAEFQLLQSQIKPHFLYNTLDTIVWLAEAGDQKQVIRLVKSLSDFFRTSLNQGKDIITLREEIQHVNSYLQIQHVRYQDILEYEILVPEQLYACLIPKITIQPLVENALYHGIKGKRGVGKICITAAVGDGAYEICVEDNGIGMDPEKLAAVTARMKGAEPGESGTFGLRNVYERIRLNFGEEYGLAIESQKGEGTKVRILLPVNNQVSEKS